MLQHLVSASAEMEAESMAAEKSAQADYETFEKATIGSLAAKKKAMEDKERWGRDRSVPMPAGRRESQVGGEVGDDAYVQEGSGEGGWATGS